MTTLYCEKTAKGMHVFAIATLSTALSVQQFGRAVRPKKVTQSRNKREGKAFIWLRGKHYLRLKAGTEQDQHCYAKIKGKGVCHGYLLNPEGNCTCNPCTAPCKACRTTYIYCSACNREIQF